MAYTGPMVDELPGSQGPDTTRSPAPGWSRRRTIGAAIFAAVVVTGGGIAAAMMDRDLEGRVVTMNWEHTIRVERWQDVTRSAWLTSPTPREPQPPRHGVDGVAGLAIIGCRDGRPVTQSYVCGVDTDRVQEAYTCGTTEQCSVSPKFGKSCTTSHKTCTRYVDRESPRHCTRTVEQALCDYVTQAWVLVRRDVVTGEGHERPPVAEARPVDDREYLYEHTGHTIVYGYGDTGATTTRHVSRREYDGVQVGEPVLVRVDRHGVVQSVRLPSEPPP